MARRAGLIEPDVQTAAPRVTAVVVSHDSGGELGDCIADLLAQDVTLQIIVVDNASRDGSLAALPQHSALERIENARNVGFGVACNQGVARATAPTLLFVNPDCRLPADTLSRLLGHLEHRPDLGMLGARLLNRDGSVQAAAERQTPHPGEAIRRVLGLAKHASGAGDEGAILRPVEATSGALMLMPRALFEALGGFDPGYVLHCEDLDLCRRVLASGKGIAVATDVPVIHLKGTSSRKRPIWVEWHKHRGMWRYFRKFDASSSPWWLRGLVGAGIAAHFPLAAMRAYWKARSQR
ncbi:MAG: glycosyltransferase family 2 protein [Xanthomonadales bacterium]|nr:glycosyltransferase family 2 protein [Xanthomonadales bacterium]